MKIPGTKEEWMIQRKLDGNLSAHEEEQFNDLMRSSAEARSFYQSLLNLHHTIKNDSENIPDIDVSTVVLQRLEENQHVPVRSPGKKMRLFRPASPRTLLAYAAILLTGLLIGSVATYMTKTGQRPARNTLSGTMAKNEGMEGYYAKNGTEIKIQKTEHGNFRLLTFALATDDTIHVTINGEGDKLDKEQVLLLFSEGIFQFMAGNDKSLGYRCSGKHIFQITDERLIKSMNISFSRNNEIFYELNPKKTSTFSPTF